MGKGQSTANHAFLCGLDNAGKTKYLYSNLIDISNEELKSSEGFNWERIHGNETKFIVWDAGGGKYIRKFWNNIVEIIPFKAVIFVVNTYEPHRADEAKEALHQLIYNPYLQDIFLVVIYNTPESKKTQFV